MSYSLALGRYLPLWQGPQRIVLQLNGERVIDLEFQDDSIEHDYAERLTRLELSQALRQAASFCDTCGFAHQLVFCQAIEQLCRITVTERAASLRSTVAELERFVSHTKAAAQILETLGMDSNVTKLRALRDMAQGLLHLYVGTTGNLNLCVPGGMRRDLTSGDRETFLLELPKIQRTLYRLIDQLIDQRTLLARTVNIGTLPKLAAEQFGVRGPLARASGIAHDAREDRPYAAYQRLAFRVITQEGGDVYARLMVLLLEALESIKLIEQAIRELPDDDWSGTIPEALPTGEGRSTVEGPHGVLRYAIEAKQGQLARIRIDTPRPLDRLLSRTLLMGAQLDNTLPIIASCDICPNCTG